MTQRSEDLLPREDNILFLAVALVISEVLPLNARGILQVMQCGCVRHLLIGLHLPQFWCQVMTDDSVDKRIIKFYFIRFERWLFWSMLGGQYLCVFTERLRKTTVHIKSK
jgi:hypothetical protein